MEKSGVFLGGGGGINRGDCLKKGAWTVWRFKGGLVRKRGRGVFKKGSWCPNAHYGKGINPSKMDFHGDSNNGMQVFQCGCFPWKDPQQCKVHIKRFGRL